jgi:polyhydroxybutyrate depolymerase
MMRHTFWLALGLLLLLAAAPSRAAAPCDPCVLPHGTYRVVAPAGWNGRTPLRLFLYLHGWKQHATDATGDPDIYETATRLGFLLVAPQGETDPHENPGWNFTGTRPGMRDDVAFLREVRSDVMSRWPIDQKVIVAGGFSAGGSMVWHLACYDAPDFSAFIPFSGGFWEPMPSACTSGPVALRHTHGTQDKMVPMEGREIPDAHLRQGDIRAGFSRWISEDRCALRPGPQVVTGDLRCDTWRGCGSGRQLQLCLHDQGHNITAPWLRASLRWAVEQSGEKIHADE